MDDLLRCAFCGVGIDHEEAIEAGWTPYFYRDETTICDDPVCPVWSAKHLHDFENEPIVKPPRRESLN